MDCYSFKVWMRLNHFCVLSQRESIGFSFGFENCCFFSLSLLTSSAYFKLKIYSAENWERYKNDLATDKNRTKYRRYICIICWYLIVEICFFFHSLSLFFHSIEAKRNKQKSPGKTMEFISKNSWTFQLLPHN